MTNSEIKINALKAIGGTEWEKAGHHRIYFNRAAENFAGIVIDRYNTNWYSAKNFEIYYDVDADEFAFRADGVEETARFAIEAIKKASGFDNLIEETEEEATVTEVEPEKIIKTAIMAAIAKNDLEKMDNPYERIAAELPSGIGMDDLLPPNEGENSFQWAERIDSLIDDVWATI